MKAACYHGLQDVRVDEVQEPTMLKGSDAIVRVTKAGICGSDLHFFNSGDALGLEPGTRLGHEFVGVVEAVGADVRSVAVGDRVVAPLQGVMPNFFLVGCRATDSATDLRGSFTSWRAKRAAETTRAVEYFRSALRRSVR